MEDAFNFFSTSKDDLSMTKFDFDGFNESDSGFLSGFTSPDKIEKEIPAPKKKIVTFKEPPEKLQKKSHEEFKGICGNQSFLDKNKPTTDSGEHTKSISDNEAAKVAVVEKIVAATSLCKFDNEASMEDYFKNLLGEISNEICQNALKKLVEIEQFEKACPHILDDLLKDAKKLEGKLLKEKMALKKRVEQLLNAFNV